MRNEIYGVPFCGLQLQSGQQSKPQRTYTNIIVLMNMR